MRFERDAGKRGSFDVGHAHAGGSASQLRERSPQDKAEGAETIAGNLDRQAELVRENVAAMQAAAAAGNLAAWTAAQQDAEQGLQHLEHIAKRARAAMSDTTDAGVRKRLAAAPHALEDAQALVAQAPAAPESRAPVLRCAGALLAALPPDPPPVTWRDADFQAAEHAVRDIFTGQMAYPDLAAFGAIVADHKDHEITRRFERFGPARRERLVGILGSDQVKWRARAMQAASQSARRADTAGLPSQLVAPASAQNPTPARPALLSPASNDATAPRAKPGPMARLHANASGDGEEGAAKPSDPAIAPDHGTARREPLGPAIAAKVPGVTYDGAGRFLVAARGRRFDVTVQRVPTGAPRVRHRAGDAVVLELPTGLGEVELADAVAQQLHTLHEPPGSPSPGGGRSLPPAVRAGMESALGMDFSAVRIHEDAQAEAVGALAFTRGSDIHVAPGRFDPHSRSGRELLGHELAHVAQQAQGRVPATAQIHGEAMEAMNDDPALEQEADARAAHAAVATGGAPATTLAKPAATGPAATGPAATGPAATGPAATGPVQPKPATPNPAAHTRPDPSTFEPHGAVDVASTRGAPIQRQEPGAKTKPYIPFRIQITRPMTGEEFKVAAHLQVFGAVIGSDWHHVKDHYTPADSPVEILVGVELFHRGRGAANVARGIDTEVTGAVAGAGARAKDFQAAPASEDKAALLAEIDRRYHAASGTAAGTQIKPGQPGRAELWRSIRDEVLFQRAYLANLPDKLKALIRVGIAGRELTPADYDQLFRIAKKIESLPPGQAADCASKVTASTTDLDQLEATIDRYRAQLVAREHADHERTAVQNKLLGLEDVYKRYRQYLATPAEAAAPDSREQLEHELRRYGFASIGEFASYLSRFEQAFEDGAAQITLDLVARYAGKLHRESQRYQDPEVVRILHGRLGGFRAQYQELDKSSKIYSAEVWNAEHGRDAEVRRLPGNGGMPAQPPTRERVEAQHKAEAAKAGAEAHIRDLAKDYPIFAEDELPADKRLDKLALAQASQTELAGVLQAHIAHRQAVVADARGQLEGNHALVYKMPRLMPTFYAQLGIRSGSIHDQILQDKMHSDAVAKVATGILVAIVTVALTVVSLGSATPAVLAAGASIGAAGISTYLAYDEYKQYTADHALAEAGFANDPSVTWLVLAVVGAGADMASAVKVVSKLASAARALDAGGTLIDFTTAVEALQQSRELDEKIAAAANKAAAARKSYAAAKDELKADLKAAASGARGALGPFTDPTVFRGLVKMAVAKLREGVHSLEVFIEQLKKARIDAQLGEMSPEELVKAKEAWAQGEALARQVKDPELLDKLIEHGLDPAVIEKLLQRLSAQDVLELETLLGKAKLEELARTKNTLEIEAIAKQAAAERIAAANAAAAERAVKSAAGNAEKNALKKYTFDAAERAAVEKKTRDAAKEAAQKAYEDAIAAGETPVQVNTAANKGAKHAAEKVAKEEAERAAREAAERAIDNNGAFDMSELDAKTQSRLATFNAGEVGGEAKRLAPALDGLSERDFLAKMASEPCTTKTANIAGPPAQTMHVYEYPEGTVVRYKPLGDLKRPGPTYSIEVKKDPSLPDMGRDDAAFKVDSLGRAVPKGPFEIRNPYPPGSVQALEFRRAIMNAGHKLLK